jgi:hypothetical protein
MKTEIKKASKKESTFPVFRGSKLVYLPMSGLTAGELNEMFESISAVVDDHPKTASRILNEIRNEFLKRQYDPFLLENDIEGFVIDRLRFNHLQINKDNISMSDELERKIDSQAVEVQKRIREMIGRYHWVIFE